MHFYLSKRQKSPKFGEIGASLIFKFGEIGALPNSGNLLKIWRDWSLPFGEIGVPHQNNDVTLMGELLSRMPITNNPEGNVLAKAMKLFSLVNCLAECQ